MTEHDDSTGAPEPVSLSHWFEPVANSHSGGKEEAFLTYAATWRGRPVEVRMSLDRYTVADGTWSPWRVYASEAREAPTEARRYGAHLTDTARERLSQQYRPVALAWTDSPAYATSRARAVAASLYRLAARMAPDDYRGTRELSERLATLATELGAPDRDRLARAADAFDAFAAILAERDESTP